MKIHQIESREREYKESMAVADANRPKVAHTPGPWMRYGTTVYSLMHDRGSKCVETFRSRFFCSIQRDIEYSQEEAEANACLIAAAPDHHAVALQLHHLMLVIESAVRYADQANHADVVALLKANEAAIAKATGAA